MFNVVLARVDYFQDTCYRNQAGIDDKNLQRRQKFVGKCDIPIQLLYWSGFNV